MRTKEGYETQELAPEATTTTTLEETVDVVSEDGHAHQIASQSKPRKHAKPPPITLKTDEREALERSELIQPTVRGNRR